MSRWMTSLEIRTKVAIAVNKRLEGAFIIDEGSLITYARKKANGVFEAYIERGELTRIPKFNLLFTGNVILLDLSEDELNNALL